MHANSKEINDEICICISSDTIGHFYACKAIDASYKNVKYEYELYTNYRPNFMKKIGFWAIERGEYLCSEKIHLNNSAHTYSEITNEIERYLKTN